MDWGKLLYFDKKSISRKFAKIYGEKRTLNGTPLLIYEGTGGIIFDIHGGGFAYGSYLDEDGYCRYLNDRTGCTVVSCSYPLTYTGKAKFPLQLETVYKTIKNLAVPDEPCVLVGHSAGANLAAGLAIAAEERKEFGISALVLNYPVLDLHCDPSERPRVEGSTLSDSFMRSVNRLYLESGEDGLSPMASPLLASDEILKKFPRTYIAICERDVLRIDGLRFFERLKSLGIECELSDLPAAHGVIEEGMCKYGSYRGKKKSTALAETERMLAWVKAGTRT